MQWHRWFHTLVKKTNLKLNISSFNKRLLQAEAPIAIAFLTFYVKGQMLPKLRACNSLIFSPFTVQTRLNIVFNNRSFLVFVIICTLSVNNYPLKMPKSWDSNCDMNLRLSLFDIQERTLTFALVCDITKGFSV